MKEKKKAENMTETGDIFCPDELELISRVAGKVVKWGMGVPALLFLESSKPLNFLASQLMHFCNPFLSVFIDTHEYGKFAGILEKRESFEEIVKAIEQKEAEKKREDPKREKH